MMEPLLRVLYNIPKHPLRSILREIPCSATTLWKLVRPTPSSYALARMANQSHSEAFYLSFTALQFRPPYPSPRAYSLPTAKVPPIPCTPRLVSPNSIPLGAHLLSRDIKGSWTTSEFDLDVVDEGEPPPARRPLPATHVELDLERVSRPLMIV